jgi:hypothetical protein
MVTEMLALIAVIVALVPFAALIGALLAIVMESFSGSDRGRGSLEIVLTRRVDTPAPKPAGASSARKESPSWR